MAPLPCSPVSNSTASESQFTEDSDDSLTTPRPGPSDPAQRTTANLSKPSLPPSNLSVESSSSRASKTSSIPPYAKPQLDGSPRDPHTYAGPAGRGEDVAVVPTERPRSVTFLPSISPSHRDSSLSVYSMMAQSPENGSPRASWRNRLARESEEIAESSADENTAIVRKAASRSHGYGAVGDLAGNTDTEQDGPHDGLTAAREGPKRRKSSSLKSRGNNGSVTTPGHNHTAQLPNGAEDTEHEGWWKQLVDKYGSVELENKGSVARDHLALERTFLAWLRTSLSFASIGIAVTQLFRLNTSISSGSDSENILSLAAATKLRSVGKPLGATFLAISILILLLGFHRYFESQHYVIRGKFPASRGTIILVSAVATALMVASLIVVVAVAPQAFET